jgi:2-polyprenyl-3-methyl-5-hydroxy-6-metoxy-1,4-benzoquinol methylase
MNKKKFERDALLQKELIAYQKKAQRAFEAGLFFCADEYSCAICKLYLSNAIYPSDREIVMSLIHIFFNIGNYRNASILESILIKQNNANSVDIASLNLLKTFTPLILESVRNELRYLDNTEKYSRDFDKNFIRSINTFHLIQRYRFELSKKPSLLDIGTGCGFLPYIARYNNFEIDAIDVPQTSKTWDKVTSILDLNITRYLIKKNVPLIGFQKKFDVISAFQICFNGHKTDYLWDIDEWKFFLKDIYQNHLKKNGILILGFNYENALIDNEIVELGKISLEKIFSPYYLKDLNWKIAVLKMPDIKNLLSLKTS